MTYLKHVLVISLLMLFAQPVSSWDQKTYEGVAQRLCDYFGCGCDEKIRLGSVDPDLRIKDSPLHHCYKPQDFWYNSTPGVFTRPVLNECPALDKVVLWLDAAKEAKKCERWYDIGVALHYFLDSKEIWNQVILANKTCVKEFEDHVNDYIMWGGDEWRACECGVCVDSNDFDDWMGTFIERIKPYVEASRGKEPTVIILSNEIDLLAAKKLGYYLDNQKVNVIHTSLRDFHKYKNNQFIIVAGGQNAKDTGVVPRQVLTDDDKNRILKAVFEGVSIKKTDVWVMGQAVVFIAGNAKENTADALWTARDDVLRDVKVLHSETTPQVQCVLNQDCGDPFWGPWVCSDRKTAARVTYKSKCSNGVCVQQVTQPSKRDCNDFQTCLTFQGCVQTSDLSQNIGVSSPQYRSWLSSDRQVTIIGRNVSFSLYVRANSTNDTSCQIFSGSDWADAGDIPENKTLNIWMNISSNRPGQTIYTIRLRCGELDSDDEFETQYYTEHNFTLQAIAPPMSFTYELKPLTVLLDDCFDRKNVSLRIENLGATNISCNYTVGRTQGYAFVTRVGYTENRSNPLVSIEKINTSLSYLSYFSGADLSTNYSKMGVDEIEYNYSLPADYISSYSQEGVNYTLYNITVTRNTTAVYQWDVPNWASNTFEVDSDQCAYNKLLVSVTCFDRWGQRSTLEKELNLELKHLN